MDREPDRSRADVCSGIYNDWRGAICEDALVPALNPCEALGVEINSILAILESLANSGAITFTGAHEHALVLGHLDLCQFGAGDFRKMPPEELGTKGNCIGDIGRKSLENGHFYSPEKTIMSQPSPNSRGLNRPITQKQERDPFKEIANLARYKPRDS